MTGQLRLFAHLAVLWAFAVAQPLFDLLADNPEFFVARGNRGGDIAVLALGLVLIPPLALLALERGTALIRPSLGQAVHLGLVGLLFAAIALQALNQIGSAPAGALLALAALVGMAAALGYARTSLVPAALSVLTPAPAVFLVALLAFSPVSELVFPDQEAIASPGSVPGRAPVVLVVFDEFPTTSLMDARGRIDASRFPSFAQLARTATWYRNATTVADMTPRAVPAILTGRSPSYDELPTAGDHPRNLFTLLGGPGGYRMNVTETSTDLCPQRLCPDQRASRSAPFGERIGDLVSDLGVVFGHLLLPDSWAQRLPAVDHTFGDFSDGDRELPGATQQEIAQALRVGTFEGRVADFERFVASIDGRGRTLHFLHVNLPHYPWTHTRSGRVYGTDTRLADWVDSSGRWLEDRGLVDRARRRHLLEVEYTDRLLGKMIRRLEEVGLFRRAILVITSDHGAGFAPGAYRRIAADENLMEVAPVPLLVKAPSQRRSRVVERHACTTDVLPIVARLLGSRLAGRLDPCPAGEVRVSSDLGETARQPFADWARRRDALVARRAGG
jgi:sulfatase-like protein